jgi:glycosyltransferase involved in cell wall biosynthesis
MKLGFDAKRIFHNTTGLGNYSRDLVRILNEYYSENTFSLYNPKPKRVHRFQLTNQTKEILPKNKFWKRFSSFWRQGPIIKQLLEDEIEIYHGLSGEIPNGIEKTMIKSVVTIHDLIFVRYPELYSFFDRKIHFRKFHNAAKNANAVIAISEQTKRDIIDFLKIDASKITVIYQGCHAIFKEKQTTEFKEKVLEKYNLPKKFILNVGTIEARKNALSLIKATKNIDFPTVIVGGKTKYYNEILTYVSEHQLAHKIYFLEGLSVQELAAIYQAATIFVYPSIFEGFGIPIIEALYSKTAVITSTGSCFSEAGGLDTIYVEPNNVKELITQINRLLESKELRDDIANKGFRFVQKFNDKQIAKSYFSVYKSVMN